MAVRDSAMRLIRMGPPDYGYHLERVSVASVDDALTWLHDQTWCLKTDRERRHFVKGLMWLRWLYSVEWQARGGMDDR